MDIHKVKNHLAFSVAIVLAYPVNIIDVYISRKLAWPGVLIIDYCERTWRTEEWITND